MTITIDTREYQQHPETKDLLKGNTQILLLDAADYAFLDRNHEPVGVERCAIMNFVQKMRSGELEAQLTRCADQFSTVVLLIEGVWDMRAGGNLAVHKAHDRGYFCQQIYPSTRYDYALAFLIRVSELGIEVLQTPNLAASMVALETLYKQRTKPEELHTLFKHARALRIPTKTSSNPSVPRLMGLCPRMSEKASIKLLFKFGSIWNILNATDAELLEVEGIGKGMVKNLRECVGYEIPSK
jgi:ERCC4-type nuclease